jgi:hypothetical protein
MARVSMSSRHQWPLHAIMLDWRSTGRCPASAPLYLPPTRKLAGAVVASVDLDHEKVTREMRWKRSSGRRWCASGSAGIGKDARAIVLLRESRRQDGGGKGWSWIGLGRIGELCAIRVLLWVIQAGDSSWD